MSQLKDSNHGSKIEIFPCNHPGCAKIFPSKFSLRRHIVVHSGIKPYICDICGKKFAMSQYLKEHLGCHTTSKTHLCGINGCQKSFRHASDLSLHRKTHPEFKPMKYHYIKPITIIKKEKITPKFAITIVKSNKKVNKLAKGNSNSDSNIESVKASKTEQNSIMKTNDIDDLKFDMTYIDYLLNITEVKSSDKRPELPEINDFQL